MTDFNIDTSNLTRKQMIVIKKLAFMAESYCDELAKRTYDPDGDAQEIIEQRANQCSDLWDKLRRQLRMHKRDLS